MARLTWPQGLQASLGRGPPPYHPTQPAKSSSSREQFWEPIGSPPGGINTHLCLQGALEASPKGALMSKETDLWLLHCSGTWELMAPSRGLLVKT